jgi:serine/threonine kinase 38
MEKSKEEQHKEAVQRKIDRKRNALDKKYNRRGESGDGQGNNAGQSLEELEAVMSALDLDETEKDRLRLELEEAEKEQQVRMTKDHFEPLALIGRGAFGEVRLVRKKDRSSQDIYGKFDVCSRPSTFVTCALVALKSMVKDHMIKKNQVAHVRAERDILTEAETENPWIVTLYYSFQVTMLATPRIE